MPVAYDKTTGGVVWKSGDDGAGYSSPVTISLGAQRIVAMFSATSLFGYDLTNGNPLWKTDWKTAGNVNASDPIPIGDTIFIASGWGAGCGLFKVSNSSSIEVYRNKNLANQAANPVLIGGLLYGFTGLANKSVMICLDPNNGNIQWKNEKASGTLIAAGNNLIIQSNTGNLLLAEAAPGAFKELGVTTAPVLTGECITSPSYAKGCVYCRNTAGDVVCLDLSSK